MNYFVDHTPTIHSKGQHGTDQYRIEDKAFEGREILCFGEIDEEKSLSICQQLLYLSRKDPKAQITVYVDGPGGAVSSGLAIYDVMQAIPAPVRTVCMGMCASMDAIIFMAGDRREMLPHSQVMIHDPLQMGGIGGSALSVKATSDNLLRTREIINQIICQHTGRSSEEVYEVTAKDTYYEADAAIEFGLADAIVTTL